MATIFSKKLKISFLLLLAALNLFSQQEWSFGKKYTTYVGLATEPLSVKMHSGGLRSLKFLSTTGGVAFQSVAVPEAGLQITDIRINYIPTEKDGHRLRIINGYDTISPVLFDWQMLPIAKYVDGGYNSCVSLFGPRSTTYSYHITYEAGFQNSLLGLRLLQADMMLMDATNLWRLPTADQNSRPTLGNGEIIPDSFMSKARAQEVDRILKKFDDYQSWVLTDANINMQFSFKNNDISFTGKPYYYFWGTSEYVYKKRYNKMLDKIIQDKKTYAQASCEDLNSFFDLLLAYDSITYRSYLYGKDSTPVMSMCTYEFKNNYDLLLQMNPPVYNAILNTAHYAAFFRYIKNRNLVNWKSFMTKVKYVETNPKIKTPTMLLK